MLILLFSRDFDDVFLTEEFVERAIVGGWMSVVSGDYFFVSVGTENIAGDDFLSYQWRLK